MTHRHARIALSVGACILLTGCAGGAGDGVEGGPRLPATNAAESVDADAAAGRPALPSATVEPTGAAEPTAEEPERNQRGNLVKALGEEAGILDVETHEPVITFAVDAIGPVECRPEGAPYRDGPQNGHLIAADLRVATAPEFGRSSNVGGYFTITGYDWSFIDPAGITHTSLDTSATWGCLEEGEELSSDPLAPASQYVGKLVFDVPAPAGTLVYRPVHVTDGGWEWTVG